MRAPAFYLGNIYGPGGFAYPRRNTRIHPSPVAKPPLFSPPRFAIRVNSLCFSSLVISLTCALLATSTSLHQRSHRYVRVSQLAWCSPGKRARMHAFFANCMYEMHIPWAVEGLPTLLHLSVLIFFGGLVFFSLLSTTRSSALVLWIRLSQSCMD